MINKKDRFLGKMRRRIGGNLYLVRFFLLLFLVGVVVLFLNFISPSLFGFLGGLAKKSFSLGASRLELKSNNGRVNVLLLGAGGTNHEGADLTDTIIFFSVDPRGEDALMLSLPRDIWIPSMRAKINTAYHYGEGKKPGGGLVLAKSSVSEILDQPVHYAFWINFDGFLKAVDLLGGVDIAVERAFDDYKYPIPGMEDAEPEELRYEHLHFEAGLQHMDAERALKYVRSRYAEGEEGTDFARSERQQKLILALKDKVFSVESFLNPKKILELVGVIAESIDTDITNDDYLSFLDLALSFEQNDLRTAILDGVDEENGYLVTRSKDEKYDYQWVLVPRAGDWEEIREYVSELLGR